MGKKELSNRNNWQKEGGKKASIAERNLYNAFDNHFKGTKYVLIKKPKHLKNLYTKVKLPESIIKEIFNPEIDISKANWGILPDFAIENIETHKIIFGEIKRQDGWVEGKKSNAGRGNVHERLCKLFTPGLQKAYREIGHIENNDILPFWVVFEGDITRDPKRNREIAFWFDRYDKNYFMWRPNLTDKDLTDHFDKYLKPYLD